ncbi:MAG: ABC transporter ATP-binding protein [Clostridiales bacterium]|nr:ABC transporter ATP-binding protein [Clostridiales bacterium]
MIEVKNLTKRFGRITAVDNVSFTVNDGEIVGFLGPNGAGKSTTMNMMTGFISSSEGTVVIDGYDILEEPEKAKKRIGYLPEIPPVYGDMTVSEYLDFVCGLKKVKKAEKKEMIEEILSSVRLEEVKDRLIKNLSKGYRQRVGLAQALVGHPGTLILDEPTVGLDPKQVLEMREVIRGLGEKHTVILSSHILQEVSAVCDRVIIINKGKIVASDKTSALSDKIVGNRVMLEIKGGEEEAREAFESLEEVVSIEITPGEESLEITAEGIEGADIREALYEVCREKGFVILVMKPVDISLEDIFMKVVDGSMEEELIKAAKAEAESEAAEEEEESGEGETEEEAGEESKTEITESYSADIYTAEIGEKIEIIRDGEEPGAQKGEASEEAAEEEEENDGDL